MPQQNHIPAPKTALSAVAKITPVLLLVLLLAAIFFYRERMLYIDAPHILFRLINDGHFWIEEHRYGSFISQVLPLMGARLHLPLVCLLVLYSVGYYLFYLTVSLLLVFRYRQYGLAVLLGLYFTLFISDAYYWPNNEVHQGIAWLLLVFALNLSVAAKGWRQPITFIVFAATFALAIWTHPLIMLPAIYLWFFFMDDKNAWPYTRTQTVALSAVLLLLAYLKFNQGMHHGYDSSKIDALTGLKADRIRGMLSSPQLHFFLHSCVRQYWLFLLLFMTGLAGLLKEKKYRLLLFTALFFAGYLALTCITFWDVTSRSYMECEYSPLVIICCAPFVVYVLPKMNVKLAIWLFVCIYMIRLLCIFSASAPFTNRLVLIEKINEKMKDRHLTKVIIPDPVPGADNVLITNWAAPVESIYISQLNGEKPQRTFIFMNSTDIRPCDTLTKDTLLGSYERRGAAMLNTHYFRIDTTTVYKVVSYDALMN